MNELGLCSTYKSLLLSFCFSLQVIRTLKNVTIGESGVPRPVSPLISPSPKPNRRGNGQLSPENDNVEAANLAPRSPRLNRKDLHSPVQSPKHTISSPSLTCQCTIPSPSHTPRRTNSPPNVENGVDIAETKSAILQVGNSRLQKGLESQ